MASSFLRELPEGLLHWITPRFAARKSFDSFAPSQTFSPPSTGSGQAVPSAASGGGERDSAGAAGHTSPWRIGQRVFHQKFGEGVITGVEGSGADARVQVNFKRAGSKWLALEYAKLTAV
jgi:DNA helicase-2/ATP-dependent DNA helicase PcrA